MPQWGNNSEDELSDYVDENFEIDETDEHWGLNEQMDKFKRFETKVNDIKKIAQNNRPSGWTHYQFNQTPLSYYNSKLIIL